MLYAVNTAGAAAGAFLTDFALVPSFGLTDTQLFAALLNVIAGAGALVLARTSAPARKTRRGGGRRFMKQSGIALRRSTRSAGPALRSCCAAFAAMGMEIVWLRHFTLLLGGFRAVFSLVLTIVLVGIGVGIAARRLHRSTDLQARAGLMVVQALLVVSALLGLSSTGADALDAHRRAIDATFSGLTPFGRWMTELWYNARPMLLEVGVPALLMGCRFRSPTR